MDSRLVLEVLPPSGRLCNYGKHVVQTMSTLIKFIAKSINIYVSKEIYYKNISHNQSNGYLFCLIRVSIFLYNLNKNLLWLTSRDARIAHSLGRRE
jgi:hypothetical protein